jgi:protein-tyrosine phosphatase
MIDIHSHLIFSTDDGPSTLEEAVRMVKEAVEAGVKVIIATPHFKDDVQYTQAVVEKFSKLSAAAASLDISLKIGYEVPVTTPDLIRYGKGLSLNNSCYLLLELPFEDIPIYIKEVIFGLELEDITPVIAHPERNKKLQKNIYLL